MGHLDIMALYEKTQFYSLYHISPYEQHYAQKITFTQQVVRKMQN